MALAKKSFGRTIDVHELEELLKAGREIKIIDVRTPAEYQSMHIPGSYNVPLDRLPEHKTELANALQAPVVLVCRSGARAEQAARVFDTTSLEQFHVLQGGISAWQQARRPVNQGKQIWSMERQVRGVAGSLVLLSVLGSLFLWKPLAWLAAFVGGGLTYSALTDTCGMAMLLSKLPYNRIVRCDIRDVVQQLSAAE
ncbi:rhodanese-like domain-containing protein [Dictyobacter aurantiacus]|uniref:Sulfurtransferase n=1 Tax=Dictyobacter aurantiacus TaxID=1936993 RepID=A0A401ZSW5_9CHLR|nr:rhodanese-like domain-containing protein [Dictyobacter aurantiacus]GCE10008.1 sulfurtransferase [Dictyobacter aurantiacus]